MDENLTGFNESDETLYAKAQQCIYNIDDKITKTRRKVRMRKVKYPRKKLNHSVAMLTEWANQFVIFAYSKNEKEKITAFENLQMLEIMSFHFLESKIGIDINFN